MFSRSKKLEQIEERLYSECMPLIYSDFNSINIGSSGSGYSSDKYDFSISPNVLYQCTKKYNYKYNYFEHLTSLRSAISILNTNKLRMYNMTHQKDQSEYLHATPKEYHNSLKYERDSIYIISGVNTSEMTEYELFNLWEKYGEDGFGVKFKIEFDFEQQFQFNDIFLKKVAYEKLDLSHFLSKIERIEIDENVEIDYKDILVGAGILHKHPRYKLENEIRLALYNKLTDDTTLSTHNPNYPFFQDYSFNSNKVSKYREIKLNNKEEIFGAKIVDVQMGYKHDTDSEAFWMVNELCMRNHKISARLTPVKDRP